MAAPKQQAHPRSRRGRHALWLLPLLCLLSACGGGPRYAATRYAPGNTIYPEPGPPEDPWRPYIRDASSRFSVPQQWIRAVMHQESGGHEYRNGEPITSGAGAMGLMQLMPATYADLQSQYNLGSDPFEPHDNILAGTAYIHQMYQKYGAPAFLAAYNAGPQRLDDYLAGARGLPNETVNYVASIAPNLGTEIAMTGPLATYASGGSGGGYAGSAPIVLAAYRVPAPRRRSGHRRNAACWHDPDAAYDPDAPCGTPPPEPVQVAQAAPIRSAIAAPVPVSPAPAAYAGNCYRDPDAAYDAPCGQQPARAPPLTVPATAPAFDAPAARPVLVVARSPAPGLAAAAASYGGWAVQVGAFNSEAQARFATTMARQAAFSQLAGSQSLVQPTVPFGGSVLYRARLAGLARGNAGAACSTLRAQNIPCMVVTPGG